LCTAFLGYYKEERDDNCGEEKGSAKEVNIVFANCEEVNESILFGGVPWCVVPGILEGGRGLVGCDPYPPINPVGSVERLFSASTARRRLIDLRLMLHMMHDLNEGHSLSIVGDDRVGRSLNHGCLHVGSMALAAWVIRLLLLLGLLGSTSWLIADELTLRTSTESRLLTLPITLSLLTHGGTLSLGSSTSSSALSWGTYSLTLGAISSLTEILRASHITLRLVTMDLTGSTGGLLTVDLTLRPLTNRVALSRAGRIITLPSALRVASSTTIISLHISIHLHLHLTLHLNLSRECCGEEEEGKDNE